MAKPPLPSPYNVPVFATTVPITKGKEVLRAELPKTFEKAHNLWQDIKFYLE